MQRVSNWESKAPKWDTCMCPPKTFKKDFFERTSIKNPRNLVFPNLIAAGASMQVPATPNVHPVKEIPQTPATIPHSLGLANSFLTLSTTKYKVSHCLHVYVQTSTHCKLERIRKWWNPASSIWGINIFNSVALFSYCSQNLWFHHTKGLHLW